MADVTRTAALVALTEFKPEEHEIRRLMVNGALRDLWEVLRPAPRQREPEVSMEDWLVERWLREVRSDAFRKTAEYEYLRAEWERMR